MKDLHASKLSMVRNPLDTERTHKEAKNKYINFSKFMIKRKERWLIILIFFFFLFPLLTFANAEKGISVDFPETIKQGQKAEVSAFLKLEEDYETKNNWEFEPLIKIIEKQDSVEKRLDEKEEVEDPKGLKFNWNFIFEEPGEYVIGFKFEAYKNEEYKYTFDKRDFEDISLEFKVEKEEEEVEKIDSKREEVKEFLGIDDIKNITEEQKSRLDGEIDNWEIAFESIFTSTNLDEKYIDSAEVSHDAMTGRHRIHIRLDLEGSKLLEEITGRNVGNLLATYIDDQKIQVATIQEKIPRGQVQISGNLNEDEVYQTAEKLGYANTITVEETEHKLEVNSGVGGNVVSPGEGTFNYNWGDGVELKAKPKPGYEFVGWAGEIDNISDSKLKDTTITIKENYSILGEFQKKNYPVTFNEENGLEDVSIEIYFYEDFTGKVNEIATDLNGEVDESFETGEYWFVAKLENYKDYEGSFEVEESSKNVNFAMKEGREDDEDDEDEKLVETGEGEKEEDDKEKKREEEDSDKDGEDHEREEDRTWMYKFSTIFFLILIIGHYVFKKLKRSYKN